VIQKLAKRSQTHKGSLPVPAFPHQTTRSECRHRTAAQSKFPRSMFTSVVYILLTLLLVFNQPQFTNTSTSTMATVDSVASSTGSNHGSVTTAPTTRTIPTSQSTSIPSATGHLLYLEIKRSYKQTVNPLLPELRDTAKKYARWSLDALNTMSSSTHPLWLRPSLTSLKPALPTIPSP